MQEGLARRDDVRKVKEEKRRLKQIALEKENAEKELAQKQQLPAT